MNLRLDYCSYEAAKYAVEKWHYSRRMPAGKLVRIGVWEDGRFVGAVVFGCGASPPLYKRLHKLFGLKPTQCCELVRVALTRHQSPVSRIVSVAIKMLRQRCPGLVLIVSFADNDQGHHGGIYQAGNWLYAGLRNVGHRDGYLINGRQVHCRSMPCLGLRNTLADARRVDPNAEPIIGTGKHQYFYPLNDDIRRQIEPLTQPYPKRAGSIASDATTNQVVEGGVTPTPALQDIDRPPGTKTQTPRARSSPQKGRAGGRHQRWRKAPPANGGAVA